MSNFQNFSWGVISEHGKKGQKEKEEKAKIKIRDKEKDERKEK